MSEFPEDEFLREIRDWLRNELDIYRSRVGSFAFEERYERMGRSIVRTFTRDGEVVDMRTKVTASSYHDWAYERFGRTPFTMWLSVPAQGEPGEPRMEFDRPPESVKLRKPSLYVQELEKRPRPPELVPGWMKVELAAVGAWNLRSDRPTWENYEPTGVPQTPESVGVPRPPGAEWALPGETTDPPSQ